MRTIKYAFAILLALHAVAFQASASANDELSRAFEKEYAYLTSERETLEARLAALKRNNSGTLRNTRDDIERLQRKFLAGQNATDQMNHQIADMSRDVEFASSDQLLLETTLLQATETLDSLDLQVSGENDIQKLAGAFELATVRMREDARITIADGAFYRESGELVQGRIMDIGRIARYGIGQDASGALAPAGNGMFRIWDETTAGDVAALLENPAGLDRVPMFLFDNPGVAVEKQEPKTLSGEMEAGGLIARIIAVLGLAGVLLVLVRILYLTMFSSNIQQTTTRVNAALAGGSIDDALDICKGRMNSASRVIAATLRNLNRDREHIEDIISESILYEASRIDRYGSAIIVIAAVSPLLGLLGTVTGMISTFDIITEFGTGDPKLLSSGISEALITTKYGLVVAIPLLLAGNLLSSWGTRTKNDLERAALHIINTQKHSSVGG